MSIERYESPRPEGTVMQAKSPAEVYDALDALVLEREWPDKWFRSQWPGPPSVDVVMRRRWWLGLIFGWECWYCEEPLNALSVTTDHLLPVSRGGADDFDNVRLCCTTCNSSKGARTEQEYREAMAA